MKWRGSEPADRLSSRRRIDCAGAAVPGFVDSHSHLVFAGDRSQEFAARMAWRPYAAGGINTTVQATRSADDQTLHANVSRLADQLRRSGITTFEIKSGYGLTVDDEARAVRLASAFTDGDAARAHVVPPEFSGDRRGYLDLVNGPMLDACTHGQVGRRLL